MHVIGTVNMTLDIHDFQIPVTFYVLPHLQFNIILGIQFLTQTKANINMECQTLTFYNDLAGTSLLNKSDTLVRTTEAILIPPKYEFLIPVTVPSHFGTGLAIIEPSAKLYKLQLALAKSLVSPINNRAVCKIMNPTDVARFLRRKTPLGIIRNCEIDSVTMINNSNSDSKFNSDTQREAKHSNNKISQEQKLRLLAEKGISLPQNFLSADEFGKLISEY